MFNRIENNNCIFIITISCIIPLILYLERKKNISPYNKEKPCLYYSKWYVITLLLLYSVLNLQYTNNYYDNEVIVDIPNF